jgi:hypothetical protein
VDAVKECDGGDSRGPFKLFVNDSRFARALLPQKQGHAIGLAEFGGQEPQRILMRLVCDDKTRVRELSERLAAE